MLRPAHSDGPGGLYALLLVSVAVTAALTAALLQPPVNPLLVPHLGAELRSADGQALPLDEPAAARP